MQHEQGEYDMKAAVLSGHGGPEMLHIEQVADPTSSAGEIVVDVHAASINAAIGRCGEA